jgi:hypothetical protein
MIRPLSAACRKVTGKREKKGEEKERAEEEGRWVVGRWR